MSKLAQVKSITDGGLEAEPPTAGGYGELGTNPLAVTQFFVTFWTKSYSNVIGSHFVRVHLKKLDFQHLKAN